MGSLSDKPVYRADTGILADLRAHEQPAAEELGQWKTPMEERKVIDASPAAITLAMVLTTAELEELAAKMKRAREAGGDPALPRSIWCRTFRRWTS